MKPFLFSAVAALGLASSLYAGGVRAPGVQVDVADGYSDGYYSPYYDDNGIYYYDTYWIGPGSYYGVWFDDEYAYNDWRYRRHGWDGHHGWRGRGWRGHGGHGHGGGHHHH